MKAMKTVKIRYNQEHTRKQFWCEKCRMWIECTPEYINQTIAWDVILHREGHYNPDDLEYEE